jgi:hypothetical protein
MTAVGEDGPGPPLPLHATLVRPEPCNWAHGSKRFKEWPSLRATGTV